MKNKFFNLFLINFICLQTDCINFRSIKISSLLPLAKQMNLLQRSRSYWSGNYYIPSYTEWVHQQYAMEDNARDRANNRYKQKKALADKILNRYQGQPSIVFIKEHASPEEASDCVTQMLNIIQEFINANPFLQHFWVNQVEITYFFNKGEKPKLRMWPPNALDNCEVSIIGGTLFFIHNSFKIETKNSKFSIHIAYRDVYDTIVIYHLGQEDLFPEYIILAIENLLKCTRTLTKRKEA